MSRIDNWAGNVTFAARHLFEPTSLDELRRLVSGSGRLHAIGTRHSFNHVADTSGDLISLAAMPSDIEIDADAGTVTAPAAIRYGDLAVHLHRSGLALGNLASLPHISVAGAVATGTHGSGVGNGSLATAVSGIEMVTADGELVKLRRGDGHFAGAVVALGALGVVVRLTLDVIPTFDIAQHVYDDVPRERLDDLLGAGYSVSLFTDWTSDRLTQVWCKLTAGQRPPVWLSDRRADSPRHPVPGMPAQNCTGQLGAPGAWHTRLPHFRLGFTPSSGAELQSEYLIARADLPGALAALDDLRRRIAPLLFVSEIRTIAADDLWLSPSYGRDSGAIHFTWRPDPAVEALLPDIEAALAPFEPRPHWGKLFALGPSEIAARYQRLPDFVGLMRAYDPEGKFRNDFIDRHLPAAASVS
jgi:xylitol oxidase